MKKIGTNIDSYIDYYKASKIPNIVRSKEEISRSDSDVTIRQKLEVYLTMGLLKNVDH